jgi:hypothetical protein
MGMVLRFTHDERGQVEAIDTLIFAALVSISALMIATYGVGSYHQDLHMQALEHRYTADLSQSFVMTSRYVSTGNKGVTYTIGPQMSDDSIFYSLSGIINKSVGKNPLERNIDGSILDIIAEDLYLGLAIHKNEESYPLNSWFLTGGFHENVNDFVVENLDFLSGGMFYYRLEASYYPYEGTFLKDKVYSEAVYTNTDATPNASVYVTEVIVPIPVTMEDKGGLDALADFSGELDNKLEIILPKNVSKSANETMPFIDAIGDVNEVLQNTSKHEVKKTGEVTIKIWPKVGGGSAERVL